MNKAQRKELEAAAIDLDKITSHLSDLRAQLENASEVFTDVKNDEEEKLDNMPDGLRSGEKGDNMQESIDQLDTAVTELEEAISKIECAVDAVQSVIGA